MRTSADIRELFLAYFQKQGHTVVPSSSLIPLNDPTLLFTSAGMVQFKNVFTGQETLSFKKAASCQKCLRAGGKHNDLENVGHTNRHHTFFEMLGNFSFGDYFKEHAILLAWEFITKELRINQERLVITVFAEDEDAAKLWRKISGLADQRIIRIASREENFWSMGDTGPCGPCSEIFYDHGEHVAGGPPGSSSADGDRFVEIWNLVFMQYEQLSSEERVALPSPSIDTGMGLERVTGVIQGVHDNYDTDIFKALINASVELSGKSSEEEARVSHRVIADHLRAVSFLIADGVLPSNEGRGYVLRRIMRRAMRHVQMLGYKESLMAKLVPSLVEKMGAAYPELVSASPLIIETIKLEDERFRQTLEKGLKYLKEESAKIGESQKLPGQVAFKLYDTYGFPLDLTQDVLKAEGKVVDTAAYEAAMAKQKEEARAAWVGSGEKQADQIWFALKEQLTPTDFFGYNNTQGEGIIQALIQDGKMVEAIAEGTKAAIITNQTPFYGESGGQVGDTGIITASNGSAFVVEDTQKKLGDFIVHYGVVKKGKFKNGDTVLLKIDDKRRKLLRANHSATHLLHAVLRKQLGLHVTQKGSLVVPDRLRFDFSYPTSLTAKELTTIENEVNQHIRDNFVVESHVMTPKEAAAAGAVALFGEKYGEEVRVIRMGMNEDKKETSAPLSMELCGGTHVSRTGDIGFFKITSETGVAAGIRRIEALTGDAAVEYVREQDQVLTNIAELLKTNKAGLPEKISSLMEERRQSLREIQQLRQKISLGGGSAESSNHSIKIKNISFVERQLDNVPSQELKSLVDEIKIQIKSGIIAVSAINEGKISLVVGVTKDLLPQFNAVEMVNIASPHLGGKGGGRPDMAQTGGSHKDGLERAFEEIKKYIENQP